ncbi:MAG: hypothetical protein KDC38_21400 [Planctomycetes bacterium]|nr:hypothetical protein [Planctomycetota bacterium]
MNRNRWRVLGVVAAIVAGVIASTLDRGPMKTALIVAAVVSASMALGILSGGG